MASRAPHAARLDETTGRQEGPGRLGVLDRQHLRERAEHRHVRVLVALSAAVLAAALLLVAGGRALVASGQVRVDSLQTEVAAALAREQNLQLERAQLESPSRVLRIAETALGMVTPSSVVYLSPVDPGQSVFAAHRVAHGSSSPRR